LPADESGVTDAVLARAAAHGDRAALETLLSRHADRIVNICRRIMGNREDALDAAQEAMLAVVRGIGRYDERAAFTTWLYRVATNAALDETRRRARRPTPVDEIPEAHDGSGAVDQRVVQRLDVDAALADLTPDFRAAVVLRDLCDLDYQEIADALGVPIGTVRSRIARGRAALASALGNRTPSSHRLTEDPR